MGTRTRGLIALAKKHLPRNYAPSDKFVLRGGEGCTLFDVEGKEYLDMLACYSAANEGHCNPRIADAIFKAAQSVGGTDKLRSKELALKVVLELENEKRD